jgi:hypothetical protein
MKRFTLIQMTLEDLQADRLAVAMEAVKLYKQSLEAEIEFDTDQAAEYCDVDVKTIRSWVNDRSKPLPRQMKNRRRYTIKKVDLDKYLRRS